MDGPFEVRRCAEGRRRWLEARIRWKGTDPATSLPWPEQWVRDFDEHGAVMNGALLEDARRMERARYGCRVPRRVRAAAFRERPADARRCSRFREDDELPIPPPRRVSRRRLSVVVEEGDDE